MPQITNPLLPRNIVILAEPYGGISIAHYLPKRTQGCQIVLVSSSAQAIVMSTGQPLSHDIRRCFVHGTASVLDHSHWTVAVNLANMQNNEILKCHTLIVGTGAATPSPLVGMNRDSHHLRQAWTDSRKVFSITKPGVIVGAGSAGVETAGEGDEYLNTRAGCFSRIFGESRDCHHCRPLRRPLITLNDCPSAGGMLPHSSRGPLSSRMHVLGEFRRLEQGSNMSRQTPWSS
ncbi:hypothetical protein CCHL11_03152 [Colletotrichum chlorophyti]|uniref:FAD/NAD(P)-binding domain-containing protein n=1 Tax=Colletotrichum chlorophyti TaxID=708187 RepID=A0A1Q8RGE2_9PEZI|nr:hypothetical protein CCHL11_03152 [Colletotrichum chlorophyti]